MNDFLIYVPVYDNTNCAYIRSSDVIRVYNNPPTPNSDVNYIDYYIKSSYISNTGTEHFSQYSSIPTCISDSKITTEVYYRNDFMQILVIFFLMCFICFWIPWKFICRIFRRWN